MTILRWSIILFSAFPVSGKCQWQSLDGGLSQDVRSIELSDNAMELIVGGKFIWTNGGSLRANGLAKWNGVSWTTAECGEGNGDTSQLGNPGDFIVSLAQYNDTLFAGIAGDAWQYDPLLSEASYLVNGEWYPCGDPDLYIFFLEEQGRLFSGGRADTIYGQFMPGVNEWIAGSLQRASGSPFNSSAGVYTSTYWHDQFYFGGAFQVLGSRKVVSFDGTATWSPLGGGVGGNFVSAMAGYGDSLYVGGFFHTGLNVRSTHLQIWDGTSWLPFFPQVEYYGTVVDIQVYDGVLYVAGIFHFAGETTWYDLLRFDGHELCAIGGPTPSGDNGEIEFFQGDLYMALGPTFEALPNENIGRLPLTGLVPDTCISVVQTGIHDAGEISPLRVSPNPAHDQLHVVHALSSCVGLHVIDPVGRVVLDQTCGPGSSIVRVGSLAPACYTVVLLDAVRIPLAKQKFIKG